MRQILFDILGTRVEDGALLDLYAGSGALGFEGLSRGAATLVAVEQSRTVRLVWERNRESLGADAEVLSMAVLPALPFLLRTARRFRWIVADPPYGSGEAERVVSWLGGEGLTLLEEDGGLVLETERGREMAEKVGALERVRQRDVGGTTLHFYARAARVGEAE